VEDTRVLLFAGPRADPTPVLALPPLFPPCRPSSRLAAPLVDLGTPLVALTPLVDLAAPLVGLD